jgi:phenylalanine-4-hydroxylase
MDTQFTKTDHEVWKILCKRQTQLLREHGCQLFWDGFQRIQFPQDHIPSIEELNSKITAATGWKTQRTSVRYSSAQQWYPLFGQKIFPVTDFVRSKQELDFTPEPDVFHDTFGHLAFFMLPRYTEFAQIFAPAFLRAKTTEEKENVKRLAWFSYEFGVKIEGGQPKAFGAGLISSFGELSKVVTGQTKLVPFTVENVLHKEKAIWSMHETLFTFENLDDLQIEIESYLQTV